MIAALLGFCLSVGPTRMPLAEVDAALASGAVLVDVRGAFATPRIVGAIAKQGWALGHLGRGVILVDEGVPGTLSDVAAASMPGARVLAGGIRAWCEAGRPVIGTCADVDRVSAARLSGARVVVVAASDGELEAPPELAARLHRVGSVADARQEIVLARSQGAGAIAVLDETGAAGRALDDLGPDVWRVEGGLSALRAAWAPAALGTASRMFVGTRDKGLTTTAPKGGCGCR